MRNSSLLALTVTVDDCQNLSMRMALAAERRRPDLGLMEPLGQHWGLFVMRACGKWKPEALFYHVLMLQKRSLRILYHIFRSVFVIFKPKIEIKKARKKNIKKVKLGTLFFILVTALYKFEA